MFTSHGKSVPGDRREQLLQFITELLGEELKCTLLREHLNSYSSAIHKRGQLEFKQLKSGCSSNSGVLDMTQLKPAEVTVTDTSNATLQFVRFFSTLTFSPFSFHLHIYETGAVKQALHVAWLLRLKWKMKSLPDQALPYLLTHLAQTIEIQYFSLHHRNF